MRKEKIRKNILSMSQDDFVRYDVVLDCINPVTQKPLVNETQSIQSQYYAYRKNSINYDADVSIESCVLYQMVFEGIMGDSEITNQPKSDYNQYGLKYEIYVWNNEKFNDLKGLTYRGDTINSVATSFYAWRKSFGSKELPSEAITLMSYYHTPGNFMILPINGKYSLNCKRGIGISRDFFDLFLLAVYNYYRSQANLPLFKEWFLTDVFEVKNETDIKFFTDYLDEIGCWLSFVHENCLEDYIDDEYRPVEFWRGHFDSSKNDKATLPKTQEEFISFWKNSLLRIKRRSIRMYNRIHGIYTRSDIGSYKNGFLYPIDNLISISPEMGALYILKGHSSSEGTIDLGNNHILKMPVDSLIISFNIGDGMIVYKPKFDNNHCSFIDQLYYLGYKNPHLSDDEINMNEVLEYDSLDAKYFALGKYGTLESDIKYYSDELELETNLSIIGNKEKSIQFDYFPDVDNSMFQMFLKIMLDSKPIFENIDSYLEECRDKLLPYGTTGT